MEVERSGGKASGGFVWCVRRECEGQVYEGEHGNKEEKVGFGVVGNVKGGGELC